MPGFATPLAVRQAAAAWQLDTPLVYRGARDLFTVPAEFTTDFASVPYLLRLLLPADDPRWTRAAVVHDWLCTNLNQGHPLASAVDSDGIFRRLARELGTPLLARWLLWTGVRWGAALNPARRPGWGRTALPVLALTLALAPLVLLAVVCPPVGVTIYLLIERGLLLASRVARAIFK